MVELEIDEFIGGSDSDVSCSDQELSLNEEASVSMPVNTNDSVASKAAPMTEADEFDWNGD